MKGLFPLYCTLLAIFGATVAQIEPFDTEICRLFQNDVKLRKPGSCQYYLTCNNGVGKKGTCTKYYNKNSQSCSLTTSDPYCGNTCKKSSPTWVVDPKSCNGYFSCSGSTGTQGYCGTGLNFDQDLQACIFESESSCKGYAYCDVVPNNVPFKDEGDCQKYYMCVKDVLTENYCEDGYYDVRKGCVARTETECEEHPVPYKICGTNKKPIWSKFESDKISCRGYYYCRDLGDNIADPDPTYGQCPTDTFFNYDLQVCYPATSVVCHWDRCDGRWQSKVISGTKGCQHYLICDEGVTVSEEKCPDGLYFDDSKMECTSTVIKYAACS